MCSNMWLSRRMSDITGVHPIHRAEQRLGARQRATTSFEAKVPLQPSGRSRFSRGAGSWSFFSICSVARCGASRSLSAAISLKMLIQQLRRMESDGIVRRIVHHQVPPKVEYGLTDWGQALCLALDAILKWTASRDDFVGAAGA